MGKQMLIGESIQINGKRYPNKNIVQLFDNIIEFGADIAAAKVGTLSVHTSSSVGTLTMAAGHGFTTGVLIDLYWFNTDGTLAGARRAVIAGTVATNSVPITGGTGDNLPIATTPIVAMQRDVETCAIIGDNTKAIFVTSPVPCFVVFAASDDTVLLAVEITEVNGQYRWYADSGVANPLGSGVTIGKVLITQSDSTAIQSPTASIGFN